MSACATAETNHHICLETPDTVIPYWVDGIIHVSSRMAEKNRYWIKKFKEGRASVDDLVRVLESNTRYHEGMIGRMEAAKECAALARQDLIEQQKENE